MNLDDALAIVEMVRGGYAPSLGNTMAGGITPNDLHRAQGVIRDELHRAIGTTWVADTRAAEALENTIFDLSDADFDLRNAIQEGDPRGVSGGARSTAAVDARAQRAPAPQPGPRRMPIQQVLAREAPSGRYDEFMRDVNPSYRQSRLFSGTPAQATEAALRHPVLGKGMSRAARQSARVAAAKGLPGLGLGMDWLSAYGEGARDVDDWMAQEEEFLTGLPGLVSPSELPPPAVLSADRKKAVEATQGMTGVAPDPESDNVTLQEVRAYIKNKVAKGEKLQKWADKITSMESGRLSIKPVNPRSKARQEAAKPQNPRMGAAKRKHGVPTRADTINRENRRKAKAGY